MSGNYITPTAKSISALLGMILGDGLNTSSLESSDVSGQRLATYINDEDKLVAACVCDQAFVVYSGAALSMIPAAGVEDMLSANEMTETIAGNFHEIMNICSRLLMSDNSAHLRLDQTLECTRGAEILTSIESCSTRLGFQVEIPGYGKGNLAIFML